MFQRAFSVLPSCGPGPKKPTLKSGFLCSYRVKQFSGELRSSKRRAEGRLGDYPPIPAPMLFGLVFFEKNHNKWFTTYDPKLTTAKACPPGRLNSLQPPSPKPESKQRPRNPGGEPADSAMRLAFYLVFPKW